MRVSKKASLHQPNLISFNMPGVGIKRQKILDHQRVELNSVNKERIHKFSPGLIKIRIRMLAAAVAVMMTATTTTMAVVAIMTISRTLQVQRALQIKTKISNLERASSAAISCEITSRPASFYSISMFRTTERQSIIAVPINSNLTTKLCVLN